MKEDWLRTQKPAKRRKAQAARRQGKNRRSFDWVVEQKLTAFFRFFSAWAFPLLKKRIWTVRFLLFSLGALFLVGASYLVIFAVSSPAAPPTSLTVMLNPEEDKIWSIPPPVISLPLAEDERITLSSFRERDITGQGAQIQDRSRDIFYTIQPGETLSEIAYSYDLRFDVLAFYNKIENSNRIRTGAVIKIPSIENSITAQEELALRPRPPARPAPSSTKTVRIAYESRDNGEGDGEGLTVQFSILDPSPDRLQSFEWDFGDGKRGFRAEPTYDYSQPKTYVVRLTAQDSTGVVYKSNPLYIDIPHPGSTSENSTTRFVTLSSLDELFVIDGIVLKAAGYDDLSRAPLDFSETDHILTKIRFTRPGFYGLTVLETSGLEQYYSIFVSPLPSMHSEAFLENLNWYRTQYNTGTSSNCGPAVVSMAISWSLGRYFPVSAVREAVGWRGDGGTNMDELLNVIQSEGIAGAELQPLWAADDLRDVIDEGKVAIILFHTGGLDRIRSNDYNDPFGRYYNDDVGHYIVIKGYSLNGEYFVVHDPIPSDWNINGFRYGDEVSMVGRNRYYSTNNIMRSLRRHDMIVVPRMVLP
ncbi:MAG: LysM peptidoglycan-binding domain-containing protein [Spirochaetales bacterium]|jgi:hypothetical protein|nr:LysM peptidoglycan-binding domain-containing protein [Spirochaetales bacterium]